MSEKEKDIMKKLADAIPKLDENKRNYILGIAEGMALAKEDTKKETEELQEA